MPVDRYPSNQSAGTRPGFFVRHGAELNALGTGIWLISTRLVWAAPGAQPVAPEAEAQRSAAIWMLYLVAALLIIFFGAVAFFAVMRAGRRRRDRDAQESAAKTRSPGIDPWRESGRRMRERAGPSSDAEAPDDDDLQYPDDEDPRGP